MRLISKENTTITDNFNLYNLKNLYYSVNDEELKGEKITIDTNYKLPKSDKFYDSAVINLNTKFYC